MIEITICAGTLCHIMGGAELYVIEEKLSEIIQEEVSLKASPCLGYCQGENKVNPPCILINGELMSEASIEKIINKLKSK